MKNKLLTLTMTGILLGATGLAQAQDIPERKAIQQDRIGNGVKNGSLTPNETKHLESREAGINRQTRRDRRQNGGEFDKQRKGASESPAESGEPVHLSRQAQRRASVT